MGPLPFLPALILIAPPKTIADVDQPQLIIAKASQPVDDGLLQHLSRDIVGVGQPFHIPGSGIGEYIYGNGQPDRLILRQQAPIARRYMGFTFL